MANWDESKLIALINNQQEENSYYEYKAAAELTLTGKQADKNKYEIRKDISVMANGGGGIIIYGMTEGDLKVIDASGKEHIRKIPGNLEDVDVIGTSTDTIYQLLDSVQRKIDGIDIEPVPCPSINGRVFVVSVPESNTIHMADPKKGIYHKRIGNHVMPMEDYEVRMGLNRAVHPYLEVEFRWGRTPITNFWESKLISGERLTCIVRHVGGPLAEKISLEIERPRYWTDNPSQLLDGGLTPVGDVYSNYLSQKNIWVPLFPQKSFEFHLELRPDFWQYSGNGGKHNNELLRWSVFADSALPRRAEIRGEEIRHEQFNSAGQRF